MARLPNMQSRQMFARSDDSLALACALAWTCACSSMFGMDEMELPRVRTRVKAPTVGDRGGAVGSVASEDLRAWRLAPMDPAVLALALALALPPPKARARVFGLAGGSARGGAGFESNRMALGMAGVSSWAMIMRQSRGNSRSISGSGPSWPLPGVRGAPWRG